MEMCTSDPKFLKIVNYNKKSKRFSLSLSYICLCDIKSILIDLQRFSDISSRAQRHVLFAYLKRYNTRTTG